LKFDGFPEPLLKAEEKFWRRWQRERLQRVIYEDIRDLENIKEISMLELPARELPNRVGSPLSVKNIKEMLQVAHETVERWLQIFERVYYSFRISPYGPPKIPAFYQVHQSTKDYQKNGVRVLPVETFCKELKLV